MCLTGPFTVTCCYIIEQIFTDVLISFATAIYYRTLEELAKEQKRKASKRKKELEEAGVDLEKEGDTTIEAQDDSAGSMLEFLKKSAL